MQAAANKLMHYIGTPYKGSDDITEKMKFISLHWEITKMSILRIPDAVSAGVYLGLPFSHYEWGGILPVMSSDLIRLIPSKYSDLPPSRIIVEIAGYGNSDGLKAFLEIFNDIPVEELDAAMTRAMKFGHTECVKVLLTYTQPSADSFRSAASFGHKDTVEETIGYMTADVINQSLYQAAVYGHAPVISVLLRSGVITPEIRESTKAMCKKYNKSDIYKLLA